MVNIAILGAGLIGQRHAEIVAGHGNLTALIDPDPRAGEVAHRFNVPCYTDIDACLAQHCLDGAIIATPNHTHVPLAERLIAHGIPSLIEKPIADTSEAAHGLATLSEQAGVPLLIGHHRRHNPIITAAKQVIDRGDLGRLTLIDAKFWLYKPQDYFDQTWRRQKGAGPIFINLIHDVDLLCALCGPVAEVQAMQSTAERGFEVEDTAIALLRFENGALGTVSLSDTTVAPWSWEFTAGENPAYPYGPTTAYAIAGTKGALSLPDMKVWHHPGLRSWWEPLNARHIPVPHGDALQRQYAHFCDVIAGRATPLVTARSATASLEVIEQIQRAATS